MIPTVIMFPVDTSDFLQRSERPMVAIPRDHRKLWVMDSSPLGIEPVAWSQASDGDLAAVPIFKLDAQPKALSVLAARGIQIGIRALHTFARPQTVKEVLLIISNEVHKEKDGYYFLLGIAINTL